MKHKTIPLTLLLCLSSMVQVYAGQAEQLVHNEIDLSSLSADLKTTHSHRLVRRYDNTNHWKACIDCEYVSDKTEHSLLNKYTHTSSVRCVENSQYIEYCSDACGFYHSTDIYNNGIHSGGGIIKYTIENNEPILYMQCPNCGRMCYKSSDGYEYKLGGSIVDVSTVDFNKWITFRFEGVSGGSYIERKVTANNGNTNISLQHEFVDTEDNGKALNIIETFEMPSTILDWSDSKITSSNLYIDCHIYIVGLLDTNDRRILIKQYPDSKEVDRENNLYIAKYSIPLDSSLDQMNEVTVTPKLYINTLENDDAYKKLSEEYSGDVISFTTNFIDPSIQSAGF